jgi:hypothetical protein
MLVDNFALTMFQACPIKYKLRIKEHWTSRRKSAALGFGACLHEGLAVWYKTHDRVSALKAIAETWPANMPTEDWRTKEKCLEVMVQYMRQYPEESWQPVGWPERPMIECNFSIDTGLFLPCWDCGEQYHTDVGICPQCGKPLEPIEYGGIFDGLIEFSQEVVVLEHKTTSQLGKYYFDQFKPNNQVSGYVWAAEKLSGRKVGGAIINAIGIYKAGTTRFERQITTRSKAEIAEWMKNVWQTCVMIQNCERIGYWPMFTQSCTMYGKCEYHNIHTLGTERERELYLEQDYQREQWSHENRDDSKDETV